MKKTNFFQNKTSFIHAFQRWGALFLLPLACLVAGSVWGQTAFLDFNTPGEYTGNFNPWNDGGGYNAGNYSFMENTSDGVGGSGGVNVFETTDMTAVYKSGSWDLSTNGATVTVSLLFQANGQTGSDKVQLGILNSTTNGLNGNAGVAFESFRFIPTGGAWSLREQTRAANATTENILGSVNYTTGHWYKFQVSVTNTSGASGNDSSSCAIFDYGTDGLTPGANIVTFSTVETNVAQDIATNTAVWPAFRAFEDAGIGAWDNFLVYTPASQPVITLGLTNASVANGQPASFKALADGPGNISYAWFTNGVLVPTANNSTYTTPPVDGSYNNIKVVASNSNGSATNAATLNVIVPTLATVTNYAATGIQTAAATLGGQVLSTGGDTPAITLYYGTNDGGVTSSAWSNSIALGLQNGAFAQTITGLSSNQTYFFTAQAVNSGGTAWATPSQSFNTLASNIASPLAAMLTYHNDNTRQGVNTNESTLTLANVNSGSFGKIFSYPVDGYVYAQPLVMTNVTIPGKGVHNVVYIVTEHDSIYAFDADNNAGANASPLWQISLLNPAAGVTSVPGGDTGTSDIVPEIGITATPVIDPVTGTLYLEAKTKEVTGGVTSYVHRLHGLDITTGAERTSGAVMNSPVVINAKNYPGTGTSGYSDNDGAGHVVFNTLREHTRVALTLANGVLYLGYASHGDNQPYHGWLFAYDAHTLAQLSVYNTTPNGGLGGFWQGGGGATVDAAGNLYYETGNGSFDATGSTYSQANNSFAMSVLKFSATNGVLKLQDYFAPHDAVSLSDGDVDLGSGAPLILPDSAGSTAHPHLLAAAGKDGRIYLIDRDNMGHFNSSSDSQIVQEVQNAIGGSFMTPVFFNNKLYYIGQGDNLKAFTLSGGLIQPNPQQSSTVFGGDKGSCPPVISANGSSNAIIWATESDAYASSGPAILHAYNATNVAQELYNSSQNLARDNPGGAVKFTVPTIVNGKAYVGAEYVLSVYGLGNFLPTPLISPNGGVFTNSVTVSLSDSAAGTTLYYTLDGTTPTTNSTLYSDPFVLVDSTGVQAIAVKAGAVNSGVASAGFINSSSVGTGTGLLGHYFANHTAAQGFSGTPTLVRIDPTIDFNWNSVAPDPSVGQTTYTVLWTGSVQPQFNETYTFSATADDGVRLFVNGQELVNGWVDQGPTTYTGSIPLVSQQLYNIEMDYYQNGGGAVAQLAWSSPSTPSAIIPEAQLYPYTNPPPVVLLSSPPNNTTLTATASATITATAAAQYNAISAVNFYANNTLIGTATNVPYTITATGLAIGSYSLVAVAADATGLTTTSAPVHLTVVAGSGLPYGIMSRPQAPAFYNMPSTFNGPLPATLSATGVFTNTPMMTASASLIPYSPIVPLWSDGAVKTRYLSVPFSGGSDTPGQQIGFAPTGEWTFPAGTVFVKTFQLLTNQSDPNSLHRLETRLLVRDTNGAVYGVTYKWRADNSDADLLTASLTEPIPITTPSGIITQNWYYPSPSDCLTCHTPAANYVLGVKTRQLNTTYTYPSGVADNELRTLNRLGMLNPAFSESIIPTFTNMFNLTNLNAALVDRARSYLDANCAQCHRPGGSGPTFDARYDTPLAGQGIINGTVVKGDLGYDNAHIVTPDDIWRSILYDRINTLDPSIQMPPLARNLIDTNAVQVMAAWINSLPGTPALAPPTISPPSGFFTNSVTVSLQPPDGIASLFYTLDGTLPTTNSAPYTGPFTLDYSAVVKANAFETDYNNSVAASTTFTIVPPLYNLFSPTILDNGSFQFQYWAPTNQTYLLQETTDFIHWTTISTNTPGSSPFFLTDPGASSSPYRFYRAVQQP